jgi:hypothetical protein
MRRSRTVRISGETSISDIEVSEAMVEVVPKIVGKSKGEFHNLHIDLPDLSPFTSTPIASSKKAKKKKATPSKKVWGQTDTFAQCKWDESYTLLCCWVERNTTFLCFKGCFTSESFTCCWN